MCKLTDTYLPSNKLVVSHKMPMYNNLIQKNTLVSTYFPDFAEV